MNYRDYINSVEMSGKDCTLCKRQVTTPSYYTSMKKWNEVYCYSCGSLKEKFTEPTETQNGKTEGQESYSAQSTGASKTALGAG